MTLIELFEQNYTGKVSIVCGRLDDIRQDFVTDEDRDEYDGMDSVEIGPELYSVEGYSQLSSDLITELNPSASLEDKTAFGEYIAEGDWIFNL